MTSEGSLYAIIPAGGAGTRLWPLSRADRPKFLLDLVGSGRSLLQTTFDRLVPLVGAEHVAVVTGRRHRDAVAAQLTSLDPANLVAEPSPRDSMPAIGLMAAILHRRDPDAVVGSFAADQLVADEDGFRATVREAAAVARERYVVTIGIEPTGPATAYGYIEGGAPLEVADAPHAVAVSRFVEKPALETARAYLAEGTFRWNAGMFVSRADVLLGRLEDELPRLRAGLDEIARAWGGPHADAVLERIWPTLTKIAIDHAVAEPVAAVGGMAMVAGEFGWTDIGDFDSVADALGVAPGESGVLGAPDDVALVDATGLVATGGRTVTVIGLRDVVVVDTDDAVLVVPRDRAQDVKKAVDQWRAAGREDLL